MEHWSLSSKIVGTGGGTSADSIGGAEGTGDDAGENITWVMGGVDMGGSMCHAADTVGTRASGIAIHAVGTRASDT